MTEEQEQTAAKVPAEQPAPEPGVAALVVEQEGNVASAVMMAAQGDRAVVAGIVADDQGVLAEGAIGIEGQDAVIVASFADMELATKTYHGLLEAEAAGRLDIEGVLVAKADEAGKVEIVKMTDHKTRNGFLAGAVAGVVAGIIFPPSILASAALMGTGGAAIGKIRNVVLQGKVAQDLASVMTPGSSGIIALARLAEVEQVKAAMPDAREVKAAPVSDEVAAAVKEAAKEAGAAPEA
jgi:uncharacterized membrane protein